MAHTILGVDWDEAGNIEWLILDPHYTGSDWTNDKKPNLSQIQSKGWVGWKKPGFWDKTAEMKSLDGKVLGIQNAADCGLIVEDMATLLKDQDF